MQRILSIWCYPLDIIKPSSERPIFINYHSSSYHYSALHFLFANLDKVTLLSVCALLDAFESSQINFPKNRLQYSQQKLADSYWVNSIDNPTRQYRRTQSFLCVIHESLWYECEFFESEIENRSRKTSDCSKWKKSVRLQTNDSPRQQPIVI